jgi:predicted N-acetyltransferase YhbS
MIVLGRLAVHIDHHGKGIGNGLLKDALMRAVQVSQIVGSRAVLVHAIDQDAVVFYVRYGFVEFPQGSRSLFLPTETIIQIWRNAAAAGRAPKVSRNYSDPTAPSQL